MAIHPGHVLQDAVSGIDPADVAAALGIEQQELSKLYDARLPVSAQLASRLESLLHFKAEHWLTMQRQWDEAQRSA